LAILRIALAVEIMRPHERQELIALQQSAATIEMQPPQPNKSLHLTKLRKEMLTHPFKPRLVWQSGQNLLPERRYKDMTPPWDLKHLRG
jgi:hypothetical protein